MGHSYIPYLPIFKMDYDNHSKFLHTFFFFYYYSPLIVVYWYVRVNIKVKIIIFVVKFVTQIRKLIKKKKKNVIISVDKYVILKCTITLLLIFNFFLNPMFTPVIVL